MAYFRCSTGSASSGDGVALVVASDADFAGSVITATNGSDTFTETCPSASPYTVRFEGIPVGTYTISGVAGGATVTTQFTVLDYTTSLHNTPNGATVTPVNNIQIWLHCADIWNKTYTTINQVLADASTLQALIASNNAVDYMARSTSWASSVTANANAMTYIGNNNYCANKLLANTTWLNAICNSAYFERVLNVKVPTMTSDTTPSGQAFENPPRADVSQPAYIAFDGVDDNGDVACLNTVTGYIGYKFTTPVTVKKVAILGNLSSKFYTISPKTFKVQYSDNGTNWTDATGTLNYNYSSLAEVTTQEYAINTNSSHMYWCIYILTNGGNSLNKSGLTKIQFYGRA